MHITATFQTVSSYFWEYRRIDPLLKDLSLTQMLWRFEFYETVIYKKLSQNYII